MELFMKSQKSLTAFCTAISLLAITSVLTAQEMPAGAEQSLQEARQLCTGMSDADCIPSAPVGLN